MAQFDPAYRIVQKHEGGYVNDPDDIGGETYRGIARKIWPNWAGWAYIDMWKTRLAIVGKSPQTGDFVPESFEYASKIDELVYSFYGQRWTVSKAGQLNDQQVANMYYDMYILSSKSVLILQQSVNQLGKKVTEDNAIGTATIDAANAVNAEKLRAVYTKIRIVWHKAQVAAGRVSGKFLAGWIKRAEQFDSGVSLGMGAAAGLFIAAAIGSVFYFKTKHTQTT